jgi:ankyrin repeat protein
MPMADHSSQHESIISAIKQNPSGINDRFVGGGNVYLTALQYAVVMGDSNLVRELLDLGADIESTDDIGSTPLMMAAYNNRRSISNLLVQRGADLTAISANGKTVLHHAAQFGDIELVKQVLDAGVPVNAADFEGYTALHCSVINDQVEAVEILLKHGADPMVKTSKSARAGANRSARDFAESFSKRSVARLAAQPQTHSKTEEKQWWEFWK